MATAGPIIGTFFAMSVVPTCIVPPIATDLAAYCGVILSQLAIMFPIAPPANEAPAYAFEYYA